MHVLYHVPLNSPWGVSVASGPNISVYNDLILCQVSYRVLIILFTCKNICADGTVAYKKAEQKWATIEGVTDSQKSYPKEKEVPSCLVKVGCFKLFPVSLELRPTLGEPWYSFISKINAQYKHRKILLYLSQH